MPRSLSVHLGISLCRTKPVAMNAQRTVKRRIPLSAGGQMWLAHSEPFLQPVFHVKRPKSSDGPSGTIMLQLSAVLLPSRARPRCPYARLGPDNCPRCTGAGFKGDSHAPAGDSSRRDTVGSDRGRTLPFSCLVLPSIANSRHEATQQEPSTLRLILLFRYTPSRSAGHSAAKGHV
jgi:hypothetical protein